MKSVREFYEQNTYPNVSVYNVQTMTSACAPQQAEGSILVVGCGTIESVMIANHNPKSHVVGIDLSKNSIAISKSIKKHYNIKNLMLLNVDLFDYDPVTKFDYVTATGVLHHIPNIDKALDRINDLTTHCFSGMVYSDNRPKYITELNRLFKQMNMNINEVRKYLEISNNEWYQQFSKNDQELADTWLHPYFTEYNPYSLESLLKKHFKGDIYIKEDEQTKTKLLFTVIK